MAENESMEGKDLASEQKREFEEKLLEQIEELKEGETTTSIEGIEVTKIKGGYTVKLRGVDFAIISEEGEFSYNRANLKEIKQTLQDEGLTFDDLGLPDLEQAIDQEEQEKKQQQRDEEENENTQGGENGEETEEEKSDEKPDLENEGDDLEKKEIAEEYNVEVSQVIHFAKDERVTENERFDGLVRWASEYDDVYAIRGENEYSYRFIGSKEGKKEEIETAQDDKIGGQNPDVTIKRIDGEKITEVKPFAVYKIDDRSVIAIVKDDYGQPEALYCRQQGGDKKQYWGSVIPEASGKNVIQQSPEVRGMIDYRYNSNNDLSEKADALARQKDLEQRGMPSKAQGVQVKEIEGSNGQNRSINIEDIAEDLMKKDGIFDRATVPPGFYENKAQKVLKIMEEDEKISYDEAVEIVEEQAEREEGGRTPGEGRNRRGE